MMSITRLDADQTAHVTSSLSYSI